MTKNYGPIIWKSASVRHILANVSTYNIRKQEMENAVTELIFSVCEVAETDIKNKILLKIETANILYLIPRYIQRFIINYPCDCLFTSWLCEGATIGHIMFCSG